MAHYSAINLRVRGIARYLVTISFETDISGASATPAVRLNQYINLAANISGESSASEIKVALGLKRRLTADIRGEAQTSALKFRFVRNLSADIAGESSSDQIRLSLVFLNFLNTSVDQQVIARRLTEATKVLEAVPSETYYSLRRSTPKYLAEQIKQVLIAEKATALTEFTRVSVRTIE